jgi:hypothetical protein
VALRGAGECWPGLGCVEVCTPDRCGLRAL